MEAIISWTNVEKFLLDTYLAMLGGSTGIAATAYLAIETQSAKVRMINAVAKKTLEPRYFDLLKAILAVAKTNQKSRDKLAHWLWGYSHDLPDAFLLIDPRRSVDGMSSDDIQVYKASDFEDIIGANDRLCGYGLRFKFILRGHVANRDDKLYHQLCAESDLQTRLNQQV